MSERDLSMKIMRDWMSGLENEEALRGKLEWMNASSMPFRELMAYYRCAMMEVETKFNVLNQ